MRLFTVLKNPRWPPKIVKIEIFHIVYLYSFNNLQFKNSIEIALSLTVFEIFAIFCFPQKFKMAAKNWKQFLSNKKHLPLPCGSKIRSKSLYLLRFSRYLRFSVFRKNSRWPQKIEKNRKFWYLLRSILYCPVGQKFDRNRFMLSAKIQDGRQKLKKSKIFYIC